MEISTKKSFDVGMYTYRPVIHGALTHKDEVKLSTGDKVAILHPMHQVDQKDYYCFGVTETHGTLTMLKKNTRFHKVVSLSYERPPLSTPVEELHLKLNAVQAYINQKAQQLKLSAA